MIVGHRGAAGLELENTLPSFLLAHQLGVDAIELDVRATGDGQLVVCHDDSLRHVSRSSARVSHLTYGQLKRIPLHNGHSVPLLQDILPRISGLPIIIDLKTDQHIPQLCELMDRFPETSFTIVSFLPDAIVQCKRLRPNIPALIGHRYTPFGIVRSVRLTGANGINLNYRWLNPLVYAAARRRGWQVMAYTVNDVRMARLIRRLYPEVWICTNHPDSLIAALRQ